MVYEKAKALLEERYMRWVIQDSLSPTDMRKVHEAVGIGYTGMRLTSVPAEALAGALAEEFYSDFEIASQIIKRLNKRNKQQMNMVAKMSNGEIESKLLKHASTHVSNNDVGKILWALVADPREEVGDRIQDFISAVEFELEGVFKDILDDEGEYEDNDDEGDEDIGFVKEALEKEVSRVNKENKKLEDKNKALAKKIDDLKVNLVQNEETMSSLKKQLQESRKESEELKIRNEKAREYEKKGRQLQQTIHKLERENRKISYDLKKKDEQLAAVDDLTKEKVELKTRAADMGKRITELEGELGRAKSNIRKYEKEREKLVSKQEDTEKPKPKPRPAIERIAMFVDVQNMFYGAMNRYNAKLNFYKLLEQVAGGRHLLRATAYIVERPEIDQSNFKTMLQQNGYIVKSKPLTVRVDGSAKGDWDMGMAIDAISMAEHLDIVALVTGDGDFTDLVKMLRNDGLKVEVFGFEHNTAVNLKNAANLYHPIGPDLLLENNRNTGG